MRYKVVCIRDRAADVFNTPAFVPAVGVAIRSFSDAVNREDSNNELFKHPEDFDLYLIGEFNDEDASFELSRPSQIAVGKDVKIS